jgi:uncharacterized delta-60 repeat protein
MGKADVGRLVLLALGAIGAGSAIARDGDLDPSFGMIGKVFMKYPVGSFIDSYNVDAALQPDGKLLLASSRNVAAPDYDFGVLRLLPNGSIDTTFGTGGQAFFAIDRVGSDKGDHVVGIALQPDQKIVLAGFANGDNLTGQDMAVVRLNANGSIDTAFGANGLAIVQFNLGNCSTNGCDDQGLRVNLQGDGKILVAGQAFSNPDASTYSSAFAIVRLTTSGVRDSTFDVDGRVTMTFGAGDQARAFRIKQLADAAHLVVVGGANTAPGSNNSDFALARLNADGSLDPTFGVGGKVTYGFDLGGGKADIATDFVELPDGKLMVCGQVEVNAPANSDFGCMRFLANGVPDPAFSPVLVPFDFGGQFSDAPLRIERDPRGRFVVAGFAEGVSGNYDFALVRLMPDGALDTTFGNGGLATFDSLPGSGITERSNLASGLAIQPDGRIILAGTSGTSAGSPQFEVVRVIGDTVFSNGFDAF